MIEKKLSNATPLDDENVVLRRSDKKHFLNKTQITNCILEAPNGVATYSGSTITVKQGLKVLIPNGRNADGTLNNIEYTIPNDIEYTVSTSAGPILMVLELLSSGMVSSHSYQSYTISDEAPVDITSTNAVWYNPKENTTSISDNKGESWTVSPRTFLGLYELNINQVTSLTPYQPVELLKRSDKAEIAGWGFPSTRVDYLTLDGSDSVYTAPADGMFRLVKKPTAGGQYILLSPQKYYNGVGNSDQGCIQISNASHLIDMVVSVDVQKGDKIWTYYNFGGETIVFEFRYAEGAK